MQNLPLNGGDATRPGLVHRIDKNTTGLMVIAKNNESLTSLSKQFFDRTIDRRYNALVWGEPKQDSGTIEGNIGRSLKNRKVMSVFEDGSYCKNATTHFKILEKFGYLSLVECILETGEHIKLGSFSIYKTSVI